MNQRKPKKEIPKSREEILAALRKNLEIGAKGWLNKVNNPLASEIDYIDQQIEIFQKGIASATKLHYRHHHTPDEPSIMQNEMVNFKAMIKVAEEYKAEL